MNGVCSLILSKSSIVTGMLSSLAMAMRCRTALVEPPEAQTAAMAFSMDLLTAVGLIFLLAAFFESFSKPVLVDEAEVVRESLVGRCI